MNIHHPGSLIFLLHQGLVSIFDSTVSRMFPSSSTCSMDFVSLCIGSVLRIWKVRCSAFCFSVLLAVASAQNWHASTSFLESTALLEFKADMYDPFEKLSSWKPNESQCNWTGVYCNRISGRVTKLVLGGFSLHGRINRSILRLSRLRHVDLSNNSLYGMLPSFLFKQCRLLSFVSLAENNFSGRIPNSPSLCWTLSHFNLSYNKLIGKLPFSMWSLTRLRSLDLSGNSLHGTIPEGIGNLDLLETLKLQNNRFSGAMPSNIGQCQRLKVLGIGDNFFSGELPPSLYSLNLCTDLRLQRNSFSGQISTSVGELANLEMLDLSSNNLSGVIPSDIGDMPSLRLLNLSRNQLSGSIPSQIEELTALHFLDLSNNRLNGSIPPQIGGAISLLELRLENNFLSGDLPDEIRNCSLLTSLILYHNNLTGSVPAALAELPNLQYVDFAQNQLSGKLPKNLSHLALLSSFNISHNNICGSLPVGRFFNTIPYSSILGNPDLCGSAVARPCPTTYQKPIVLNPNYSAAAGSSSSSSSGPQGFPQSLHHRRMALSVSVLFAIGGAVLIVVGVVTITILNIHARSAISRAPPAPTFSGGEDFSYSSNSDPNYYGKLVMFSGEADFVVGGHALLNKDCELGRGGFGIVYHTALRDGSSVAIKKLTVLVKSQEEFETQVKKLGMVDHENLVRLKGYYWTSALQLLICEYVPNGSLYRHLHEDDAASSCLTWPHRFSIILGMAKGLTHLHQANVIHCDLKSSNVMVDDYGRAKVGDWGVVKLLPMLDRGALSSKIQCVLGYTAPELACQSVKITRKSDVYGFGILVLEVVTGKRPVEYMEDDVVVLCDMVRAALEDGCVEECVDQRLAGHYAADEAIPVIKLGLICASQVPSNRPDMEEVVNILELIQSSTKEPQD